ncbi:NlpC/P60 family protein [Hathewaya histolytica]|uniref:C40 family peptidase n=1 Tax=Hathewaya histolytica TaxID=1498 RepID=UPI003B684447
MNKKVLSVLVSLAIIGTISTPVFASPSVEQKKNVINSEKQQITKNQAELDKSKVDYNKAIKELQAIEIEIEKLDNEIGNNMVKIQDANKNIDAANNKINKSKEQIAKTEDDMKEEKKIFSKRAKNLYMSGSDSFLEIVLNSNGLHDFISRIENLRSVSELDKKIIGKLKEQKSTIEKEKAKLEKEKKKLVSLKSSIETDLSTIKKSKDKQEPLIAEANKRMEKYGDIVSTYEAKISENQNRINSANNEISNIESRERGRIEAERISRQVSQGNREVASVTNRESGSTSSSVNTSSKKPTTSTTPRPTTSTPTKVTKPTTSQTGNGGGTTSSGVRPSRGGSSGTVSYEIPKSGPAAQRAVEVAKQFIGSWYVWGGTTPQQKDGSGNWIQPKFKGDQSHGGFDCSGLVQFAYGRVGIGLSRTTYTQVKEGIPVTKDQLQVGDLVFFGSASSPHHVGLYVGGGQYVHAPRTGDRVKISSVWGRGDYCGARRVAY